ncbi:MAG: hypothetical protein VX335_03390 [Pseudomonadota bacterium]|nr:hypothetical protein [Pseudomonadota bacterium]
MGQQPCYSQAQLDKKSYFHLMIRGMDRKKITIPAGGFKFPIRQDITDIILHDAKGNPIRVWNSVIDGNSEYCFTLKDRIRLNIVIENIHFSLCKKHNHLQIISIV